MNTSDTRGKTLLELDFQLSDFQLIYLLPREEEHCPHPPTAQLHCSQPVCAGSIWWLRASLFPLKLFWLGHEWGEEAEVTFRGLWHSLPSEVVKYVKLHNKSSLGTSVFFFFCFPRNNFWAPQGVLLEVLVTKRRELSQGGKAASRIYIYCLYLFLIHQQCDCTSVLVDSAS